MTKFDFRPGLAFFKGRDNSASSRVMKILIAQRAARVAMTAECFKPSSLSEAAL